MYLLEVVSKPPLMRFAERSRSEAGSDANGGDNLCSRLLHLDVRQPRQ